jgi:uncharacterized alkaline shock family protein YloU
VPTDPTPGRALVTRRAVVDIVRTAVLGSYGVTGFAGEGLLGAIRNAVGLGSRGIRVAVDETLAIDLDLTVAHGLPIAEVARQVDSAVRYAIRRALEREVDRLAIHVDGLRVRPAETIDGGGGRRSTGESIHQDDLAASGTDVA